MNREAIIEAYDKIDTAAAQYAKMLHDTEHDSIEGIEDKGIRLRIEICWPMSPYPDIEHELMPWEFIEMSDTARSLHIAATVARKQAAIEARKKAADERAAAEKEARDRATYEKLQAQFGDKT